MNWLNRLMRKNKVHSDPMMDALLQARQAVNRGELDECFKVLSNASSTCKSAAEREALFGTGSVPTRPSGMAGLVYRHFSSHHDVNTAWQLLDYCEKEQGTGMGLSEVWFSIAVCTLEQKQFDLSHEAFARCLRSQPCASSDLQRGSLSITPYDFAQHCIHAAERWVNAEEFVPALRSLQLVCDFATSDEAKSAISRVIASIQKCQQARRSRVRHAGHNSTEQREYADYLKMRREIGEALYDLWMLERT